jgi:hypothetical protein
MTFPDDVAATLAAVCAKYPGPVRDDSVFGLVLNETAWVHRATGWGLSRKDGGRHVDSPVGPIAEDVLHHQPSNLHWDVLAAAAIGNPLDPARGGSQPIGQMTNPARPWVAPVDPGGASTVPPPVVEPPPVTEPPPTTTPPPTNVIEFAVLNQKLDALLAGQAAAKDQQAADTDQIGRWMVEQAQGVVAAITGALGGIGSVCRYRSPFRGGVSDVSGIPGDAED